MEPLLSGYLQPAVTHHQSQWCYCSGGWEWPGLAGEPLPPFLPDGCLEQRATKRIDDTCTSTDQNARFFIHTSLSSLTLSPITRSSITTSSFCSLHIQRGEARESMMSCRQKVDTQGVVPKEMLFLAITTQGLAAGTFARHSVNTTCGIPPMHISGSRLS